MGLAKSLVNPSEPQNGRFPSWHPIFSQLFMSPPINKNWDLFGDHSQLPCYHRKKKSSNSPSHLAMSPPQWQRCHFVLAYFHTRRSEGSQPTRIQDSDLSSAHVLIKIHCVLHTMLDLYDHMLYLYNYYNTYMYNSNILLTVYNSTLITMKFLQAFEMPKHVWPI